MNAEQKIARFLKDAHPSKAGGEAEILASRNLFSDGWIDSLLVLKVIAFLDREFGVKVPPLSVTKKGFCTVAGIANMVQKK